ncbi:MAG: type II secretion system F family protein [Candidatus ainarchaeum sp.]|nr:type II secretion system F family protein [Candidatus ainarchaeum sp.]
MAKYNQFVELGRLAPRNTILQIGHTLDMAGVDMRPEVFVGIMLLSGIMTPAAAFIIVNAFYPEFALVAAVASLVILSGLVYGYLNLRTDERKNKVEAVFPDFLHLASSNVRAGMPIEQALWFAARPEFGLLSQEIELLTRRTYSGEPFVQSIRQLSTRFKSSTLDRTINLIVEGMSSGGEVAALLEKTSEDLQNLQLLQKEIAGTMLMYVIFIVFASCIGAPVLYALSSQLILVSSFIWDEILKTNPKGFTQVGMMFLTPQKPGVEPNAFSTFALAATVLTTFMSSLIISVIRSGNQWNGLKHAPFMVGGGLLVFFVAQAILRVIFASVGV